MLENTITRTRDKSLLVVPDTMFTDMGGGEWKFLFFSLTIAGVLLSVLHSLLLTCIGTDRPARAFPPGPTGPTQVTFYENGQPLGEPQPLPDGRPAEMQCSGKIESLVGPPWPVMSCDRVQHSGVNLFRAT